MSNTITFYKQKSKSDFEKNIEKLGGFNSERALKIGMTKLNNHINILRVEKKVFKFILILSKSKSDTVNLFEAI